MKFADWSYRSTIQAFREILGFFLLCMMERCGEQQKSITDQGGNRASAPYLALTKRYQAFLILERALRNCETHEDVHEFLDAIVNGEYGIKEDPKPAHPVAPTFAEMFFKKLLSELEIIIEQHIKSDAANKWDKIKPYVKLRDFCKAGTPSVDDVGDYVAKTHTAFFPGNKPLSIWASASIAADWVMTKLR